MTQARKEKDAAEWWRLGKFGFGVCIFALIISATYWFDIITGHAHWRTWVGAICFVIWSIGMIAMDRQGRRAAQRHKDAVG